MDEIGNAAKTQQIEEKRCESSSGAMMPYKYLTLKEAESYIEGNLITTARAYVATGYFLKRIRDDRLFLEDGYKNFDEYVQEKYGKKKDWASRCIKVNNQLSLGGDSPYLSEEYKGYTTYQLVELAYMTEEQREQATPDYTVKQLRDIRKPKEIPYFEIPGQQDFETDFPEIFPTAESEPELPSEPQVFEMDVVDMITGEMNEPEDTGVATVATTEEIEQTGKCLHRSQFECTLSESSKNTPGDGTDCSHSCCWECVKHGACRLECYASANRPEEDAKQETEPEEQPEPRSAYGTHRRVYPADSMIATDGCEGGHDCFSCAMECQIRGKDRYCREAPMGNPFSCAIMNALELIREEIGNRCKFINHDLAFHRAGDGEANPCCRSCEEVCGYRCQKARREERMPEQGLEPEVIDAEFEEVTEEPQEEPVVIKDYDRKILKGMIQKEQEALDMMRDYWEVNQPDTLTKYLMKMAAYQMLLESHENEQEPEEAVQPELPVMKNNEQRKEWLKTFHEWSIWFEVPEASEVYYRYDLPDGYSLVICEYHEWLEWREKYGYGESPDVVRTREYLLNPGYHYLHDCQSNQTAMVEKLKEIQKRG